MAFGNYSNNRDSNKPFSQTIYSYRMNNAESSIDKTCLSFSMWNRNLKITIAPRKDNTDEIAFDMDRGISCYLSHTKAYMLANEIRNFLRDPDNYTGCGVVSGQSVVTISNGKELGANNPVLIIRKTDESGIVSSSFAYEFKRDYHFSVRNYSGGREFIRETASYNTIEIEECLVVLEEYYKAMTNMIAYSIIDTTAYTTDRIQSNLRALAEKMGVDLPRAGGRSTNYSSATNFFNNAANYGGNYSNENNGSYPTATLDDID